MQFPWKRALATTGVVLGVVLDYGFFGSNALLGILVNFPKVPQALRDEWGVQMTDSAWWRIGEWAIALFVIAAIWIIPFRLRKRSPIKAKKGRTVLEKHRAREAWRTRIEELISEAPTSKRSRDVAQQWRDEVVASFQNLLVDPTDMIQRFSDLTAGVSTGGNVKEAIRKGVQFLKDRRTIDEGDIR